MLIQKPYYQLTDEEIIDKALDGIIYDLERNGIADANTEKTIKIPNYYYKGFYVTITGTSEGYVASANKPSVIIGGKTIKFRSPLCRTVAEAGNFVIRCIDLSEEKNDTNSK